MTLLFALLAFTPWWGGVVAGAFAAAILAFQINSAWADKAKANTALKVVVVILVIATWFFVHMAAKTSH